MYLTNLIASLLRPVMHHPSMALTDTTTESLLTSEFWIVPVYEEQLHAAPRFRPTNAAEFKRPTSNLVKIASHTKDKSPDNRNRHALHAPITEWIGADCPVDFLNVWFPAHWAPIVLTELQRQEDQYRCENSLWFDAPSTASDSNKLIKDQKS